MIDERLWKFELMAATNEIQSLWSASGRNAMKDIFAINAHKTDLEIKQGRVTAADVAKSWNENYSSISDCGEPMTESYVDTCLYVKTKILCMPEILSLLMDDVETFGHAALFDSPSKMRIVAQKTLGKSTGITSYVFRMLYRMYTNGVCGPQSVRDLDCREGVKKGLVDVMTYLHGFIT